LTIPPYYGTAIPGAASTYTLDLTFASTLDPYIHISTDFSGATFTGGLCVAFAECRVY